MRSLFRVAKSGGNQGEMIRRDVPRRPFRFQLFGDRLGSLPIPRHGVSVSEMCAHVSAVARQRNGLRQLVELVVYPAARAKALRQAPMGDCKRGIHLERLLEFIGRLASPRVPEPDAERRTGRRGQRIELHPAPRLCDRLVEPA